jgi:hypothetical protein
MSSSPSISLFSAQPELNQQPYSFLFSILAHGLAIGLLLLGFISAPKVKTAAIAERYEVRHLDLHTLDSEMEQAVASTAKPIHPHPVKHSSPPAAGAAAQQSALRQVLQAPPGPQTLVQPDIPKPATLTAEIPVPTIVISNAADTPSKTIVPPVAQQPPVSDVKPSLQKPNDAPNLAEVAIPAAAQPVLNQPIVPSTTAPVILEGPKPTPPAPISTAASTAQPTNATVISLSNTRMANGAVALPPVNEVASTISKGALAPGQPKDSSQEAHGDSAGKAAGKAGGTEAGKGSAAAEDRAGSSRDAQRAGDGEAQRAKIGSGLPGSGPSSQSSGKRIRLPKEGQFGAVVVGSSLADKYPETAELWSGKVSYTVYLNMGLAKSWILTYSLPSAGGGATPADASRLEAPWPYERVLPNIPPDTIDADALMIHGFVNLAGRFEALAIVFPPEFAQAQFVLNALSQWQFRPATQNGQDVRVEVLLIIPEEAE